MAEYDSLINPLIRPHKGSDGKVPQSRDNHSRHIYLIVETVKLYKGDRAKWPHDNVIRASHCMPYQPDIGWLTECQYEHYKADVVLVRIAT